MMTELGPLEKCLRLKELTGRLLRDDEIHERAMLMHEVTDIAADLAKRMRLIQAVIDEPFLSPSKLVRIRAALDLSNKPTAC